LTFKEFAKLSDEEQRAWGHKVLALEKEWLAREVAKRRAEWILVVGGKVIRFSSNLEKLPSKKEVYRIAKSLGFAPFLYAKEILIEESREVVGGSAWSQLSLSDFYPTIALYVGRSNWADSQIISQGKPIVADFDTGCSAFIVDEAAIDRSILSDIEFRLYSTHLNQSYDYRVCKIKVAVRTKEGKIKSGAFLIRLVTNWQQSPFRAINPARKALVGRELALRLLLNVLLKANEKETEILK
jgi:hypothetical protein